MRCRPAAAALVLAWSGGAGAGEPGQNEGYLGSVAALHTSPRQIVAGVGAELGYRRHGVAQVLQVNGGMQLTTLSVPSVGVVAGVAAAPWSVGHWTPALGLELTAHWGRLRFVTVEDPEPPRWPATAARVRLRPLVFAAGAHELSALEVAWGRALESVGDSQAFGITVLAMGRRW